MFDPGDCLRGSGAAVEPDMEEALAPPTTQQETIPLPPSSPAAQPAMPILRDLTTAPGENVIDKVSPQHERMIDLLLTQPGIANTELAQALGLSSTYVSMIKNSDMFKLEYARRRNELNLALGMGVQRELMGLTSASITRLTEIIQADEVDPRLVLATLEKSAKLALPAELVPSKAAVPASGQAAHFEIHIGAVDKDTLARAREKALQRQQGSLEAAPVVLDAVK